MAMKTPGVYIVEKSAFPNSVVEVATAIPAFIGYTERANNGADSLRRKPWRIASVAEYERYFGGAPEPKFSLKRFDDKLAERRIAADAELAKSTAAAQEAGTAFNQAKAVYDESSEAKAAAAKRDELKPLREAVSKAAATKDQKDAAEKAEAELANLEDQASKSPLLKTWQDRQRVADAAEKALVNATMSADVVRASTDKLPPKATMAKPRTQVTEVNKDGRKYLLMREPGAAGHRYLMHPAMRHFFQNGGGPCYIVSVGLYDESVIEAGDDEKGLAGGLTPLKNEQEPTLIVVPDAVLLPRAECVSVQIAALKHCGYDMKNRVAVLDVWGGELGRQDPAGSCIDEFRKDIGVNFLDYAAAYYPWLNTSLMQTGDFHYWMIDSADDLAAILWEDLGLSGSDTDDKRAEQQRAALIDLKRSDDDWVKVVEGLIDGSSENDDQKATARQRLRDSKLKKHDIAAHKMLLDKSLLAMSDLFAKIREETLVQMNLMPPSAAMAGLYTMVDSTRGVWKAPANVSVAGVVKPAVEISHADQEDLNVTTQGKSINAIRSFVGEGALVWGARTLDGNSLDWRYINVRRTMIMLEESCRLAAKGMVFEPNVANTWVTIKSMISNFLTGIWKRGGLAGAVSDDAFSVHVGLGETMTPEDILEGILRVTVLVAISRPAEFIEITFQQQMQKS